MQLMFLLLLWCIALNVPCRKMWLLCRWDLFGIWFHWLILRWRCKAMHWGRLHEQLRGLWLFRLLCDLANQNFLLPLWLWGSIWKAHLFLTQELHCGEQVLGWKLTSLWNRQGHFLLELECLGRLGLTCNQKDLLLPGPQFGNLQELSLIDENIHCVSAQTQHAHNFVWRRAVSVVTNTLKIMGATMLLLATSNGVGMNVRLVGYGLSVSRYQGIFTPLRQQHRC